MSEAAAFDLADAPLLDRWRRETPGVAHRVHLNNAGAALMPAPVVDAMVGHLRLEAGIGGYEAADAAKDAISQTWDDVASLVGAHRRNIAVVANATDAFTRAVSSFDFAPGDVIVTSQSDYTSNQIQYLALSRRLGVEIVHAPDLPEGGIDPDGVRAILAARRVRLVSVSWIPTHGGLVQDVEAVGRVCESFDVPYLVDACQALGQMPIDVDRLRCDYLSTTARKFLRGPRGIGFLYASDRALARGDHPLFVDMRGARWMAPDEYLVDATARRYEDWEFPYALVLGMAEAVRYARAVGIDVAQRRAWGLAAYLRDRLATLPGVRVLDRGAVRCALVTASFEGHMGAEIVRALAAQRINAVSTLREFAQRDFGARGVESAVRLSPHYYNTAAELDVAMDALSATMRSPG